MVEIGIFSGLVHSLEALGAVVAHDVADAHLLVLAVVVHGGVVVMWLVFLVIEVFVVQLADAPHDEGYNDECDECNSYIHCFCKVMVSCCKFSEFISNA